MKTFSEDFFLSKGVSQPHHFRQQMFSLLFFLALKKTGTFTICNRDENRKLRQPESSKPAQLQGREIGVPVPGPPAENVYGKMSPARKILLIFQGKSYLGGHFGPEKKIYPPPPKKNPPIRRRHPPGPSPPPGNPPPSWEFNKRPTTHAYTPPLPAPRAPPSPSPSRKK